MQQWWWADWWSQHWVEVLGFVSGAVCVVLAWRRNMWNYPVGLVNNGVFLLLFTGSALYADAGLQLVFFALGVAGWLAWARARRREREGHVARDAAFVRSLPPRAYPWLLLGWVVTTALLAWVLHSWTDSTTELADAGTTAGSLVAQLLLNRRYLQNWLVWLAVDVAYVGLYAHKDLWITAVLYLGFCGLCLLALREWRGLPRVGVPPVREPERAGV